MNKFHHLTAFVVFVGLLTVPQLWAESPSALSATAVDVSMTPGATTPGSSLVEMYPKLKEDGFPMRFKVLETTSSLSKWSGLDLTTQSAPLKVSQVDNGVSIDLPNGGKCLITMDKTEKQGELYQVNFSDQESGVPKTIPVKAGNIILLGSPQNNASDYKFILITLSTR